MHFVEVKSLVCEVVIHWFYFMIIIMARFKEKEEKKIIKSTYFDLVNTWINR